MRLVANNHCHLLDNSSCLWRFRAFPDSPRTYFVGTTCEVADELKHVKSLAQVEQDLLTSRQAYPAWVILGKALLATTFSSSAFLSSEAKGASRSSNDTENGMRGSPGLLVSIHCFILGNHLFFFRM